MPVPAHITGRVTAHFLLSHKNLIEAIICTVEMDNIERRKINSKMKKIEPHMWLFLSRWDSQPLIIDLEDQYNSDRKPVFSRFERVKKNLLAHLFVALILISVVRLYLQFNLTLP